MLEVTVLLQSSGKRKGFRRPNRRLSPDTNFLMRLFEQRGQELLVAVHMGMRALEGQGRLSSNEQDAVTVTQGPESERTPTLSCPSRAVPTGCLSPSKRPHTVETALDETSSLI